MAKVQDVGRSVLKWLPFLAILYAAYQYYADRGIAGFMKDVQSISLSGLQGHAQSIVIGFALIIGAPMVSKYVPNASLKYVVKAIMYYVGASQLLGALRSGAGYGGGRGYVSRGRVVA